MSNWANRVLAVVNTFVGRPNSANTDATYQTKAAPVNENFQAGMLAIAHCAALGTECTDNSSTTVSCRVKLPAGRFATGDRVTVLEDRPTARAWCALVTAPAGGETKPRLEFGDADLHDATKAGTADYDAIRADLLVLQLAPLDRAHIARQALLLGGVHGLSGTDLPWKRGESETIEDRLAVGNGIEATGTTTDDTLTTLLSLPVPNGSALAFEGRAIGRDVATGITSVWKFEGGIKNTGGTTAAVGAGVPAGATLVCQDAGAVGWGCGLAANNTTDALDIKVEGALATIVDWAVYVKWTGVA